METEVTDIQTTYTAEHPSFTVVNTTDRSRSFIPPTLVEIFSNTHRPAEQSDQNTVKPIPTPPHHTHSITDKHSIFLPNITNSTPAENSESNTAEPILPLPNPPKNHLHANVTNPDIETEYNLSVNKSHY